MCCDCSAKVLTIRWVSYQCWNHLKRWSMTRSCRSQMAMSCQIAFRLRRKTGSGQGEKTTVSGGSGGGTVIGLQSHQWIFKANSRPAEGSRPGPYTNGGTI